MQKWNYSELTQQQIKLIAHTLLQALRQFELKKTVHKGICLSNIFISNTKQVKLAHSGFQPNENSSNDKSNLAPQILSSTSSSHNLQSDIWSFGNVLFQLFFGKSMLETNSKFHEEKIVRFPRSRKVSKDATNFMKSCLQYEPKNRNNVYQLLIHPWISTFNKQSSPCSLVYSPFSLTRIQEMHLLYSKTLQIKQRLKQYDLMITKSFKLFKEKYLETLAEFYNNFLTVFDYLNSNKNKNLLHQFHKFIFYKMQEIKQITIHGLLPQTKAFRLNYHHDGVKCQINKVILNILRDIKYNKLYKYQSVNDAIDQILSKPNQLQNIQIQLVYQLLRQGNQYQNRPKQSQKLWRIIKVVIDLIESNFKQYVIRYEYHDSLNYDRRKQISELKAPVRNHIFQQLYNDSHFQVNIQKMDILVITKVEAEKPLKNNTWFYQDHLQFLKQTSSL